MAGAKKRVLITGVSRFLGLRLAMRLDSDDDVEAIVGVDLEAPPIDVRGLEFVRVDIRNPLIARVLEANQVDTIVHTNITSTPGRFGGRPQMKENNVIGTMQLLAAAQRSERVKKVVVKSSTSVYGAGPAEPSLISEDYESNHVDVSGYAKDCSDAETFARDFGRRRPDVELVVLRTQNVVGPTVRTSITDYLSLPVVPTALGYDPRLQLLHEEDAIEGLRRAMAEGCRGIFNLSSEGVVYLSKAIRLLGHAELPLLAPVAQSVGVVLRRFGVVDFPLDQLRLLLFGRVVDTRRARQGLSWTPKYTTESALRDFRDHRDRDFEVESSAHPEWERELFEYLRTKVGERESV